MTVEESDKFMGKSVTPEMVRKVFRENVDVVDSESGKVLAKFRRNVIPLEIQKAAYTNLLGAAKKSMNRGTAGGEVDGVKGGYKVRKSGKVSKTMEASIPVDSGIVGYFDRNPRMPNCRLTAFTQQHFDKFKKAYPMIKFVDQSYAKLMPSEYKKQRKIADRSSQDFIIKDTAFSTVTVNKNYQTAIHKDSGDFKDGFGNLVAMRRGQFDGCYLTLVRWGVAFDIQNGDLLLMDVHQWHGNTPMVKHTEDATRLSLVMYYRENIIKCGTMAEELEIVKHRKKGDNL